MDLKIYSMTRGIEVLRKHQTETDSSAKLIKEAAFLQKNRDWLPYSMAIAVKVQGKMIEKGITQTQLAASLGCTQQYVSVLLKGRENLTLETISKLEKVLDIPLLSGLSTFVNGYTTPETPTYRHLLNDTESPEYGSKTKD